MPPDPTAVTVARQRGYDLTGIRARRICAEDFHRFDLIVGMDFSHLKALRAVSPATRGKVRLLMDFATGQPDVEVPDPYNDDRLRYILCLELIEIGCKALAQRLSGSGGLELPRPWLPRRLVRSVDAWRARGYLPRWCGG